MKFKFLGIMWNFKPLLEFLWVMYLMCMIGGTFFLDKMSGPVITVYGILFVITLMTVDGIDKKFKEMMKNER